MRPRYSIARFTMELTTIAGGLLIAGSVLVALRNYLGEDGVIGYLIAGGLAVNGIAVIAGAQLGNAALDTAISTREMADAMGALIGSARRVEPEVKAPNKSAVFRAER